MFWRRGMDPSDQRRDPAGRGLSETPTPPYMPQTPTPPYAPGTTPSYRPTGGPLRRLAEMRRAARMPARHSAHPDGAPAPLPAGLGAGGRATSSGREAGGQGRVVQRFSGSGLAPKAKVRRQEQRARRTTVVLAVLAVLLIASSAMLIFNPAFELPSFGFALSQRLHKQPSNIPLYVDGTQPPTPTTPPTAQATPPPKGSSNGPAATPSPTAKPTPKPTATPTPTPTPTVIPSGAIVKFTAPTASISKNSFTGCGSGCDFQTAKGSGSGALSSGGSYGPSGWQSTAVGGTLHVKLEGVGRCDWDSGVCSGVSQTWYGSNCGQSDCRITFTFKSGTAPTCKIAVPNVSRGNYVDTGMCPWWYTTSTSYVGYGNLVNGATTSFEEWLTPGCSSGSPCGWYITWVFSYWNNNWPSQASYRYITSTDCNNAISSADGPAKNSANSAMSSWVGGRVALDQSTAVINNSSVRYCSPSTGTHTTSKTTGHAEWSWNATVFDPNAAVSAASAYIKANVPASYILTAGPTTCSASQAGSSGNYSYSGGSNGTVTVTCAASGTATYDWTADAQGTSAQDKLKQAIAGKTLAQAQAICNGSYPGIMPGSCSIQLIGGNVSVVPSDTSKIQIQPS